MIYSLIKPCLKRRKILVSVKRWLWRKFVLRRSKQSFLENLKADSNILDVGCGNNSPLFTKRILPQCNYTGIDIQNYNQTNIGIADNYIITTPDKFSDEISKFRHAFDAVISTHNLEHCNERERVLTALLDAVKVNGSIYLSFPCEQSVNFPNRHGTLNYFDDETHLGKPPEFSKILNTVSDKGFLIEFSTKNYKPLLYWLAGLFMENMSRRHNKVYYATWAYYGFESIICAKKIK